MIKGDVMTARSAAMAKMRSTTPVSRRALGAKAVLGAAVLLGAGGALADVVRDGSVGDAGAGRVATAVGPDGGTDFLIGEADGRRSGNNLFHSFEQFDLTSSERAVYQGSPSIRNLITRVTGGASSIDGVIRSEIAGANLYFINPAGVVFGENASVDVSGAFYVSTADRLIFENREIFESRFGVEPLLSVEDVAGFGFLDAPAPISIRGSQIDAGVDQSLGLIGGDLEISGGRSDGNPALFSARSGRIDLASLASAGEVFLDGDLTEGSGLRVEGVARRGDIRIADDVIVSTSGVAPGLRGSSVFFAPPDGSGAVSIYADDLLIENADIRTQTVTNEDGEDVNIELTGNLTVRTLPGGRKSGILAGTGLNIQPTEEQFESTQIAIITVPFPNTFVTQYGCDGIVCGLRYDAGGRAGDVNITAANVMLEGGARITASSESNGDAGRIRLRVTDTIRLAGADQDGERSGITNSTDGRGNPGEIEIDSPAANLEMLDQSAIVIQNGALSRSVEDGGRPGEISIDVARLDMRGDSRIDSSTRGAGPGGNIVIRARDSVRMRGRTSETSFTGITALSQPDSTGSAGNLRIETAELLMNDGAEISAKPVGENALGDAGNLEFDVSDQIRLQDSAILTDSDNAAGGNITAFFGRLLRLNNSEISATVTQGDASGGNVTLTSNPGSGVVLTRSEITARADQGFGGNILIETDALLTDRPRSISASSNADGLDGVVEIRAPQGQVLDLSGDLEAPPVEATALLSEPCAAARPSKANSLVVLAQEGMPLSVEAVLPAFLPANVYAELGAQGDEIAQEIPPVEERIALASVGNLLGSRSGECID